MRVDPKLIAEQYLLFSVLGSGRLSDLYCQVSVTLSMARRRDRDSVALQSDNGRLKESLSLSMARRRDRDLVALQSNYGRLRESVSLNGS